MTDLLTPPPEHELPPARAADIRRVVMRSATGTGRRRRRLGLWVLVPVLAVLTVIGAVIGLRSGHSPAVLGSPSPAPSVTSPAGPADDGRVDTDAGPLSEADAVAVLGRRHMEVPGAHAPELARVLVSRRTTTDLGPGTFIVWADTKGSTWWSADTPGVMGASGPVSGPAATTIRVPDAAHPVIRRDDLTLGWREDDDTPAATARDLHTEGFYLVAPSVERVEVRMTSEGDRSPWFSAPAHDGYVYVPAVLPGPHSTTERDDATFEDRAFDRDGNQVPIAGR